MTRRSVSLMVATWLLGSVVVGIGAQPIIQDKTTDNRLTQLERKVASLEQDNQKLRDVIRISSSNVTIEAPNLTLKAQQQFEARAGSGARIEAGGTTALKGALITLN